MSLYKAVVADALVRQLCVDIIGKMLTSLHASSATLNEKSESLDQLVANIGTVVRNVLQTAFNDVRIVGPTE